MNVRPKLNPFTDPGPESTRPTSQQLAFINQARANDGLDPLPSDEELTREVLAGGFLNCLGRPY